MVGNILTPEITKRLENSCWICENQLNSLDEFPCINCIYNPIQRLNHFRKRPTP